MRKVLFYFYSLSLFLLMPAVLFAQDKGPTRNTQAKSGTGGAIFKDLATTWWLWAGIIVILGLVGFLLYLRNKGED